MVSNQLHVLSKDFTKTETTKIGILPNLTTNELYIQGLTHCYGKS